MQMNVLRTKQISDMKTLKIDAYIMLFKNNPHQRT